jgi:glycosyltransferase involved in cell wall biosynthesis
VHHGLPIDLHRPTFDARSDYLAFLGRLSPDKRPDRAIAVARAVGMPLKIAARADKANEGCYFHEVILPLCGNLMSNSSVIDDPAKTEFLGHAAALLFPVDWPEPFGLVMIEAMACGTPVIAFPCGSVPEVIEDGLTGRIVSTMDEAAQAVAEVVKLDRKAVRRRFEERFSAVRMTEDYLRLYCAMTRRRADLGDDVPSLAAASDTTARPSSGRPADISGDRDLIRDNAPVSHELCTDQA